MLDENATTSGDENSEAVKDSQNSGAAMEQAEDNSSGKVQQLESQLLELGERLQKQSAIIGKLTNEKKGQDQKADESIEAPEKTGEVSQYKALEEKLDLFQRRFQKQENAAKLSDIELALVEAGASPHLAKEQADYFAYKLGDRITAEELETGEVKRSIVDTDGVTSVPMLQWAKAHIESDAGSYLRATKTGPSIRNQGAPAGQAQKIKLASSEYSKQFAQAHAQGKEAAESFTATHSLA